MITVGFRKFGQGEVLTEDKPKDEDRQETEREPEDEEEPERK